MYPRRLPKPYGKNIYNHVREPQREREWNVSVARVSLLEDVGTKNEKAKDEHDISHKYYIIS